MWCCLLWPRIAKMKGLSEQRVFKTIPPFCMCVWGRKCGVYRGMLGFSSSVCLCVPVCPDRISRVKWLWLLSPAFKGGQIESSSPKLHKLNLLLEMPVSRAGAGRLFSRQAHSSNGVSYVSLEGASVRTLWGAATAKVSTTVCKFWI